MLGEGSALPMKLERLRSFAEGNYNKCSPECDKHFYQSYARCY